MSTQSSRKINCRYCGKETDFSKENPYRPFCSERCKLLDLGQWASEDYKIPLEQAGSIQELAEQLENEENSRRDTEENLKKN